MRPDVPPIGLHLAQSAKQVGRAFNDALAIAGGSLPTWRILSALAHGAGTSQNDLAREVGIEGPTLTRHLDVLEAEGLVRRVTHPDDRRAVRVETTPAGNELHRRLLGIAREFDARLRRGIPPADLAHLRTTLAAILRNAG
jgi:MarR family transcriptional regulator for hemolysin